MATPVKSLTPDQIRVFVKSGRLPAQTVRDIMRTKMGQSIELSIPRGNGQINLTATTLSSLGGASDRSPGLTATTE